MKTTLGFSKPRRRWAFVSAPAVKGLPGAFGRVAIGVLALGLSAVVFAQTAPAIKSRPAASSAPPSMAVTPMTTPMPPPPRKLLEPSPGASAASAAASAVAAGSAPMGHHHRMMAPPGPGNTAGWSLMSPQEREQHHQRLHEMKTRAACERYMQTHHREMMARAQERHRPEPQGPRHNLCQELP